MGAQIEGAGTSTIRVQGVERLHGAEHTIIADRIEAGTFLHRRRHHRAAICMVNGCVPGTPRCAHRQTAPGAASKSTEAGANALARRAPPDRCRSVDMTTEEYPGFATDLQAQYMALMTQAEGIAIITETIFENRFMHAQELMRMGANIRHGWPPGHRGRTSAI